MMSSSTRCSSTGAHVGWTMNTSVPRMFSSIWNETSVSGKPAQPGLPERHAQELADVARELRVRAAGKHLQIAVAGRSHTRAYSRARRRDTSYPDPTRSRLGAAASNQLMVGAEGFEPSNTGSKDPRLTAWPRPITLRGLARVPKHLSLSETSGSPQARAAAAARTRSATACACRATCQPGRARSVDVRRAASRRSNRPKTADPEPDIAATTAPASTSAA